MYDNPEGKRPRGRPKVRWWNQVKADMEKMGASEEDAEDRSRWRSFVVVIMQHNGSTSGPSGIQQPSPKHTTETVLSSDDEDDNMDDIEYQIDSEVEDPDYQPSPMEHSQPDWNKRYSL
ncbi:hypothetical protein J6590_030884 [Homalodisca vitripennis]|nr:hypothetical protein J6590_030884 [Homalodisca vitripennis]